MDAKERQIQGSLPVKVRLENQTIPEPNTGCLLWTGLSDKDGYGKICIKRKSTRTHRVAYELAYGPIPAGQIVQHKCDTPACCNPDHLQLGTWLTNMQDKVRKGRLKNQNMSATHCKRGHEFSLENTKIERDGKRTCIICRRERRGVKTTGPVKRTHCKWGHEFTPENIYWETTKAGNRGRHCRACNLARSKRSIGKVLKSVNCTSGKAKKESTR